MIYKLENEHVKIEVCDLGAELQSLCSKDTGIEYLWQPGTEIWPHHSMLLFPNPGRIAHDRVIIGGKVYPAMMHGFANDMLFSLAERAEDRLVLELTATEYTRKYFPYSFRLQVEFRLEGDKVTEQFRVINEDDKDVYFSLGAHPGFYCPISLGDRAEDHSLVFDRPQNMDLLELEPGTRLLTGGTAPMLRQQREIPLGDHFFDNGPMLLGGIDAGSITLKSKTSGHFVELGISDFPYMCLWGVGSQMSIVCIEPWCGMSDRFDTDHVWETKLGIECVKVGEIFRRELTFRMG